MGRDNSEFITNESMTFISKKNFKYNVNVYSTPWNLRLKLIKMLEDFRWDFGHVGGVLYSTWNGYVSLYGTCTFQNISSPRAST